MARNSEFDRFFDLLPAYVRGELHALTRRDFERALSQSKALQQALENEQEIAGEVKAQAVGDLEVVVSNTDERFGKVSQNLRGDEAAGGAETPATDDGGESSSVSSFGALSFLKPSNWRPAVALSVFAMGMSGVAAAQAVEINRLETANYQLASGCEDKSEAAVIAEFADTATWPQITQLLAEEKLSIIKMGAFGTVELGTLGNESLGAAQLERLRASPLVSNADAAK